MKIRYELNLGNTCQTHICQSLDLSFGQGVVVDPELIDKSRKWTASLVVTNSSP